MSMLAAATAAAFDSTYTSIAANRCKKTVDLRIGKIEYAVSRICAGAAGYKVYVDEEDLRETLTIGKSRKQALKEPAATIITATGAVTEDAIAWRIAKAAPFAVIVGWSFADQEHLDLKGGPNSARLLAVIRLPPGPICTVAYIDRAANPNANALARKAADEIARTFKCGADVRIIGKRSEAINARFPLTPNSTP